ncbi:MAG: type II toxin-antitoxin system ParD family antitoxin [Saprospiraceae bacterium]|nr:type II toxin-antitoxin system ParD family antitoxin [Saprospiraceae bacterium]MBK8853114.1 type II toxin-antitoxin system ParD family antitoxin [Saprospiraceae bacterium]
MCKHTSVSLGYHFEEFVQTRIGEGRHTNASEVIRAGLKLPENEEQKFYVLRKVIRDVIDSGLA